MGYVIFNSTLVYIIYFVVFKSKSHYRFLQNPFSQSVNKHLNNIKSDKCTEDTEIESFKSY